MKGLFCAVAFTFFLSACSDAPNDSLIKNQVIESVLGEKGSNYYRVENFTKLNGFAKDAKHYIADIQYDVVFTQSFQQIAQRLAQDIKPSPFAKMQYEAILMTLKTTYGDFNAGLRVEKKDSVSFIKTENGWYIKPNI